MNPEETSAPEHRTPEAVIDGNWRLQCCGICDKDRVGDEPGDVHAGEWICQACLDAAPCERCDGNHDPLGACPADDDVR